MGNVFSISCDNVLSRYLDCIARQPNYAFHLGQNLALLRNDWDELKRRMNDIKGRIDVEERHQQMKRLKVVDGWLSRVEAMEAEVDKLIRDCSRESVNKCLGGYCPKNCKTSYKLGRKVAKKQREVTVMLGKGNFDVLTDQVCLPRVDERPAEPTLGLETTFNEVWSCIDDEQVGMIGLYGMGGVGKTTLLTQVNNKLCNSTPCFDVVIWIVVSKTPNLTIVQDDIGEKIGLSGDEWKYKSLEKKALDIFRVLKDKKYVLLLDDLWERLDLMKLGVPRPNLTNKSKVVFTTRLKDVCSLMEAPKKIKVKCLGEEEAWELFQKKVGEEALKAHQEIPELAKVVAKECGGLPLALITIGRAMASKIIPQAWHHAIEMLKRYASEFSGMGDEVLPLLKFSYDSLSNDAIRSCFLYCSLYPEDDEISKKELIDYWICEGFLIKFNNLSKARNEGHDYISTLIHASLLEESSTEKVKMHDVIRDMAIWITSDCGAMKDKFFVQARAGLKEIPNVADWEGAERVSLMDNKITKLTGTPKCPNLVTLFLNDNRWKMMITSYFFHYMPNIRVLNLSGNLGYTSFPTEICELVSLQYLDLSRTSIQELPTEFQNLINLKYLNLSGTEIRIIREGMFSSFKKLQMLKLDRLGVYNKYDYDWEGHPMEELESLEYLNDLTLTIKCDSVLLEFSSSSKLMNFTTALHLAQFSGSKYMDLWFLKEMRHLERLDICGCESLEQFIISKGEADLKITNHNYFPSLRYLGINNCPILKDLTWVTFAPNLEEIVVVRCEGMQELVGDWEWADEDEDEDADHQEEGGTSIPFVKLRTLTLDGLPELESIYPISLRFPCLKHLNVIMCLSLKKLPFYSNICRPGCEILIEGSDEWWQLLQWEDSDTRLAFLPYFRPSFQDLKIPATPMNGWQSRWMGREVNPRHAPLHRFYTFA